MPYRSPHRLVKHEALHPFQVSESRQAFEKFVAWTKWKKQVCKSYHRKTCSFSIITCIRLYTSTNTMCIFTMNHHGQSLGFRQNHSCVRSKNSCVRSRYRTKIQTGMVFESEVTSCRGEWHQPKGPYSINISANKLDSPRILQIYFICPFFICMWYKTPPIFFGNIHLPSPKKTTVAPPPHLRPGRDPWPATAGPGQPTREFSKQWNW